jgi:hypothetical protein
MPCSLARSYHCFGGAFRLFSILKIEASGSLETLVPVYQITWDVTFEKPVAVISPAMRKVNLTMRVQCKLSQPALCISVNYRLSVIIASLGAHIRKLLIKHLRMQFGLCGKEEPVHSKPNLRDSYVHSSILMLSNRLLHGLLSWRFRRGFPVKMLCAFLVSLIPELFPS